jgi:formate dehydrogenase gamma subunit
VANCGSCHGVHDILPPSDPRSTVNPKNLPTTCGKCHAGVGKELIGAKIHVRIANNSEHPVVRWIRLAYLLLIPLTIGFMLLHNGLDFFSKLIRRRPHHGTGEQVPRMNIQFRIAHWMVMVSFITLVVTGFALKFPESAWVKVFQTFDPTSAYRPWIHRIAAIIITFATVYHVVHMAVVRYDRVILKELLPNWQDAKDLFNMLRYNLGLTKQRPTFGMFGYPEKMEYWAFLWGTIVMAVTGGLLWAENWTLRHFPKWVLDAATAAHWYEAILATLSILVWHWYLVIFDPDVYPMDMAWLTGNASADHMRETRPEYYRKIVEKSGPDPDSH